MRGHVQSILKGHVQSIAMLIVIIAILTIVNAMAF
jgi:hypothetical protein